jgi:hypothetical protein
MMRLLPTRLIQLPERAFAKALQPALEKALRRDVDLELIHSEYDDIIPCQTNQADAAADGQRLPPRLVKSVRCRI